MCRSITVTVDAEVCLRDIDTKDLREELQLRGEVAPPISEGGHHPLHELYYALKFGMNERADQLARAYVCDQLGVVL